MRLCFGWAESRGALICALCVCFQHRTAGKVERGSLSDRCSGLWYDLMQTQRTHKIPPPSSSSCLVMCISVCLRCTKITAGRRVNLWRASCCRFYRLCKGSTFSLFMPIKPRSFKTASFHRVLWDKWWPEGFSHTLWILLYRHRDEGTSRTRPWAARAPRKSICVVILVC